MFDLTLTLDALNHPTVDHLLKIDTIYYEPDTPYFHRGQQIFDKYPNAERIEVPSHWNIPGLHGNEGMVEDWIKIKRNVLVLGTKKGLTIEPNSRSSDFTAPSHANGCSMACAYCVEAGTMIATPLGEVPVEQIRDGDVVFAYDSSSGRLVEAHVSGTASRQVDEVLEIQVGDKVLRVTAEHPIMTRRGWVKAGELTSNDNLLHQRDELLYAPATSITRLSRPTTVYNFHVPTYESYIANGVVTHNCYVPRRKGFANPITTFVNIEKICAAIERHAAKRGHKPEPNQAGAKWMYEIGTNSDCSVDAAICDNMKDLIALFRRLPNAMGTFATKFVNHDMLDYDPQGKTRVRFSVMPQGIAKVLDVRTSKIADRVRAMNDFVEAGYEVNVNFAPVIYYDGWERDYDELFTLIDDTLTPHTKAQLSTEIIFLTHNDRMHEVNLRWHPQAEELMWKPEIQETKYSQTGGRNIRYKTSLKGAWVNQFTAMLQARMPYCTIRYAF